MLQKKASGPGVVKTGLGLRWRDRFDSYSVTGHATAHRDTLTSVFIDLLCIPFECVHPSTADQRIVRALLQ